MTIIPAIDIIEGKCVRLTGGDYAQKSVYADDPLEMALQFEAAGLSRLHLVDLDGARRGTVSNWPVLERIATATTLAIDFGGGIKTEAAARRAFDAGATWVTIGSMAVKEEPEFSRWLELFGASRFFLGADVKGEKIAINGWLETTEVDVVDFIGKYQAKGIVEVFCTDVSKDGKLLGPSLDLYERLLSTLPALRLTASGGVSCLQDLNHLRNIGCAAAIVGKAIYENHISLDEISQFNLQS